MTLLDGLRRHHPFGCFMIALMLAGSCLGGGAGLRMVVGDGDAGLVFSLAVVALSLGGLLLCRGLLLWRRWAFGVAEVFGWILLPFSVGGMVGEGIWDLFSAAFALLALLALLWIVYIREFAEEIPAGPDPAQRSR